MKKILCAFCGLSAALSVWAASSEFSCEIEDNGDGTCVLTAVRGVPNAKVELPSAVDGKTVTSLGDSIFKDYPDDDDDFAIPEVVIPDSVTTFSGGTFDGCDHVERVVLPSALKHIEGVDCEDDPGWRFLQNRCLVSLSFSNGRTSNDDGTYFLADEDNRMLVHKTVTSEGDECQNLIAYASGLGDRKGNGSFPYPSPTTVNIPDGITGIALKVFEDLDTTKSISFPASLRRLGPGWEVRGLGELGPLEKVEIRGENEGPYRIIGNSRVDTRTKTLMQATLNTVIPSDGSVARIAPRSFCLIPYWNGAMGDGPDVVVPDAVEEIGVNAFIYSGLSSVTIGNGVGVIGGGAFANLRVADDKGLRFFSIAADNPTYEVVNGCIVRKTDNTFVSPAVPQRQYQYKPGVPGIKYMYEYDLEVPYYCTKILPQAMQREDAVRTLVVPKDLAYDDDIPDVEYIRIADCRTMTDVLNSGTYASLKEKLQYADEFDDFTFTDKPQCAVRTVGPVTVSGYGRYAPNAKVTLKAIYVEKGKQVVWYRYNEARDESSRTEVGQGNSLSFEMPQGNVFFSAELIDAKDGGDPASSVPYVAGDDGATVTGDATSGWTVTPSEDTEAVVVTIPSGVDAAKVTVVVAPETKRVTPNGAAVKVVRGDADITGYLDIPSADASGVIDLNAATVKEEIVKAVLSIEEGAEINLSAENPTLTTAETKPGLTYQLYEGATLSDLKAGDSKIGDGSPWTPKITEKGGASGFYTIQVTK